VIRGNPVWLQNPHDFWCICMILRKLSLMAALLFLTASAATLSGCGSGYGRVASASAGGGTSSGGGSSFGGNTGGTSSSGGTSSGGGTASGGGTSGGGTSPTPPNPPPPPPPATAAPGPAAIPAEATRARARATATATPTPPAVCAAARRPTAPPSLPGAQPTPPRA
jgi:hypothetical protein